MQSNHHSITPRLRGLPAHNGQFAFAGFQFSPTVPADSQSDTQVEESSAPLVRKKSVKDAVESPGAGFVASVMPEVSMVIPDRREGSLSGASVAVGTI